MKLTEADIEDDDVMMMNSPERFNREISPEDLKLSKKVPIVIKYDYIDLGTTDYNFCQIFHHKDTMAYFSLMKSISSETIDTLAGKARDYHFYRSEIRGNLRRELWKIMPEAVRSNPVIFHFALYTQEMKADRKQDIRSPRVYFMLGTYGHIYIIFFDPYHEINP